MAHIDAHLVGDDGGPAWSCQPRRTEQQHVVEGLLAPARGGDEDRKLLADLLLAHIVVEALGPQRALDGILLWADGGSGNEAVGFDHGGLIGLEQITRQARLTNDGLQGSDADCGVIRDRYRACAAALPTLHDDVAATPAHLYESVLQQSTHVAAEKTFS